MTQENVVRRLAAIMSADVVGYSRLMGADEIGTLQALKAHRRELVDPAIKTHHGRIVKTTGDGMLVEFPSVIDAVSCAVAIQRDMIGRNARGPEDKRIVFRIGINIGDIIIDGDDIFGEGVNVAARLEAICEPGGLCISRAANDQIRDRLSLSFADQGEQALKNISRTVGVFGLGVDDLASIPEEAFPVSQRAEDDVAVVSEAQQKIGFCIAPDGAQIAYATVGSGPPLVKAPNWLTHLEYEWQSPFWRHLLEELSKTRTLVRFDQRANGLSDQDVEDISLDAFVSDLETVVDALNLDRFPLLGISQGCAISAAYAVRHPERVSHLIFLGGFARGAYHRGQAEKEQAEAMLTLIRYGWGEDNPALRQMFTSRFIPDGTPEQVEWFNELQRKSASAENAVRLRDAVCDFQVTDLLARVSAPTLVMHCKDDAIVPFSEGSRLAAMIPGARFVPLEGKNHMILEHEPAWAQFLEEVRTFLQDGG
jgi:class 3 adenylate cyclase/pimeloyl-ACP methyl ester carboxylesterase